MGYEDRGFACREFFEAADHGVLGAGLHRGGRLVQHEHDGVAAAPTPSPDPSPAISSTPGGECADVPMEGGEFWALGEDGGELMAFFVAKVVGVTHHPAGDLPDAWWCRGNNTDASAAPRPQSSLIVR
ncbi:hypothetical protein [Streptomyces sp. NPDC055287]